MGSKVYRIVNSLETRSFEDWLKEFCVCLEIRTLQGNLEKLL